jgi:hypothetical protein
MDVLREKLYANKREFVVVVAKEWAIVLAAVTIPPGFFSKPMQIARAPELNVKGIINSTTQAQPYDAGRVRLNVIGKVDR